MCVLRFHFLLISFESIISRSQAEYPFGLLAFKGGRAANNLIAQSHLKLLLKELVDDCGLWLVWTRTRTRT